jgi:ATP-dependent Clp protease protease subunit
MKNNHKPWTIRASAGDEITIELFEMIGEDVWSGEGTTAKSFAEDLKASGAVSRIHLRVNSPGGNCFEGLAIHNLLLSSGATVTAEVLGVAASIASVIIMAASRISMSENSLMMIHNPSTAIGGDAAEFRRMADTLDRVRDSMVTAYRRHTKKTKAQIADLMQAETWFSAAEAVDAGFATDVTDPDEGESEMAANFDISKFRNVPAEIAARLRAPRPAAESQPLASVRERHRLQLELLRRLP